MAIKSDPAIYGAINTNFLYITYYCYFLNWNWLFFFSSSSLPLFLSPSLFNFHYLRTMILITRIFLWKKPTTKYRFAGKLICIGPSLRRIWIGGNVNWDGCTLGQLIWFDLVFFHLIWCEVIFCDLVLLSDGADG